MRKQRWSFRLIAILLLLASRTLWSQNGARQLNQTAHASPRLHRNIPEVGPITPGQASTVSFSFGTIDYPNSPQTVAQAINKKGEIVGSWGAEINNYRQGLPAYGFSLRGSSFKKIVYPSAPITVPLGVNSSGEIVGYYSLDPQDNSGHGFTLVGSKFTSVDYPGTQYTELVAINKSGEILTNACFSGVPACQSYTFQSGTFSSQIQYPGSSATTAYGINDGGEIVGIYSTDSVTWHGFTLISGTFMTVDYPGATDTYLTGINNTGQIIGAWDNGGVDPYGNPLTHGFLLDSGTFTSFDSPYAGVTSTTPFAINDKGVIVGWTVDANDFFLGFAATIGK